MKGRLSEEFRGRTKAFAAGVIRLFVKLPKNREECVCLANNCSVREHQLPPTTARPHGRGRTTSSFPNWGGALQEADESSLWLELLREECGIESGLTKPLEDESSELMAIFTTMINKTKNKAERRNAGKTEITKAENRNI